MIESAVFEARIDRTGEHHLWRGATSGRGHGQVRVDGRLRTAAQVAWELANGPIPSGHRVRSCPEVPLCVRADHLSLQQHGSRRSRAPRGLGSIRDLGDGRWKLVVDAGRDDTGRRRRLTKTVYGTRREATHALAAFAADVKSGRRTPAPASGAVTVDDLVVWYISFAREVRGLARMTVSGYETVYGVWLRSQIGHRAADRLTAAHIDGAFAAMRSAGLSRSRMNHARSLLSGAYKWGRRHQKVVSDPMVGTELPRSEQTPRRAAAPQGADLLAIIEEASRTEPELHPVLVLAAVTGMRRGELAGLRRNRLDLDRGVLVVDRSISQIGGQVEEKPTKTHASRTVRLDVATVVMLREHLAAMDARAGELLGAIVPRDGFVFSLEPDCSQPMPPDWMTRAMTRLRDLTGIDATMQSLRKWASSELLDSGFSPAAVSDRQGHTVQVLLGSYSARRASADQAAADHLGSVIHRRDRPDREV